MCPSTSQCVEFVWTLQTFFSFITDNKPRIWRLTSRLLHCVTQIFNFHSTHTSPSDPVSDTFSCELDDRPLSITYFPTGDSVQVSTCSHCLWDSEFRGCLDYTMGLCRDDNRVDVRTGVHRSVCERSTRNGITVQTSGNMSRTWENLRHGSKTKKVF